MRMLTVKNVTTQEGAPPRASLTYIDLCIGWLSSLAKNGNTKSLFCLATNLQVMVLLAERYGSVPAVLVTQCYVLAGACYEDRV